MKERLWSRDRPTVIVEGLRVCVTPPGMVGVLRVRRVIVPLAVRGRGVVPAVVGVVRLQVGVLVERAAAVEGVVRVVGAAPRAVVLLTAVRMLALMAVLAPIPVGVLAAELVGRTVVVVLEGVVDVTRVVAVLRHPCCKGHKAKGIVSDTPGKGPSSQIDGMNHDFVTLALTLGCILDMRRKDYNMNILKMHYLTVTRL